MSPQQYEAIIDALLFQIQTMKQALSVYQKAVDLETVIKRSQVEYEKALNLKQQIKEANRK